jgi:hypothetical protein
MQTRNDKPMKHWIALTVSAIMLFSVLATTDASAAEKIKTYNQKGNALRTYDWKKPPFLNNTDGLSKEKPKKYVASPTYWGRMAIETRPNTYKPQKFIRKAYTFKTDLFLSMYLGSKRTMTNPQSMALTPNNEYLYVVYETKRNYGRIFRYHYAAMVELGLNRGDGLARIRSATYNASIGRTTPEDNEVLALIHAGPEIPIGHGQTLAYNSKTETLWMFRDETNKNGGWKDANLGSLQRINTETLRPDVLIKFRMKTPTGNKATIGHVMTFDHKGRGYFVTTVGNSSPKTKRTNIYRFTISKKFVVKVNLVQQIKIAPNPVRLQGLAFNPKGNRLVLFAEDAITTIPVDKFGKLKKKDLQYMQYKSKREPEGMCFSTDGYAYLLFNQGPELLKSTTP